MAYTGSGTAADPYIVDNWTDFLAAANVRYDVYVKWADKPASQKIVSQVTINATTDIKAAEVDFNGWTFEQITVTCTYPTSSNIFQTLSFSTINFYNWY